jgi:fluoride exporter
VTWWEWLLVGVAGGVGAPTRYLIDTLVAQRVRGVFPFGTLAINVSGSFALGLIAGLTRAPQEILGTGLVGAYTTFSTFSFETVQLLEDGETRLALLNVVVALISGSLAAAAGLALAGV